MTIDQLTERFDTEYPDIPYSVERMDYGYRFKLLNHKDFYFVLTDEAFEDDLMDLAIHYFNQTPEKVREETDRWLAGNGGGGS